MVIVTFEHVPANLMLKLLCTRASVNLRNVQRGYADLVKLGGSRGLGIRDTAADRGGRQSQLTVAQVRAQVRRAEFAQRKRRPGVCGGCGVLPDESTGALCDATGASGGADSGEGPPRRYGESWTIFRPAPGTMHQEARPSAPSTHRLGGESRDGGAVGMPGRAGCRRHTQRGGVCPSLRNAVASTEPGDQQ